MTNLSEFGLMCRALGSSATEDQVDRLLSWMTENVAQSDWGHCADIALFHNIDDIYTDIRMRMAESGF